MNKDLIEKKAYRLTQYLVQQGFLLSQIHTYGDADGNPIYWRLRLKHKESGEKMIRPMSC
jgi:hypothetical protein